MLQLQLRPRRRFAYRPPRQVQPIEGDVGAAVGKLQSGAAPDPGSAPGDYCRAAAESGEPGGGLGLSLLTHLFEEALDRRARLDCLRDIRSVLAVAYTLLITQARHRRAMHVSMMALISSSDRTRFPAFARSKIALQISSSSSS